MLGSAMGSAFKKIEWALENVDSLERAAGFTDLYLDLHTESLKEFVRFEKREKFSKKPMTDEYLAQLNSIIKEGYLEEFIMDQFSMIMIVPETVIFDFEGFASWKIFNPISINLNERFYLVSYGENK